MSKKFNFKATVTPDGSGVTLLSPDLFRVFLGNKANEVIDVEFTVNKIPRTLAQNRYIWGVVYPTIQRHLRETTGENFTPEEIHMFNLQKIQKVHLEYRSIAGEDVMVIEDTKSSKMSVEEFSSMIENIILFCAETWGLEIPAPKGDNTLSEIYL
jgi:hypothetical protein